MSTQNCLLCDQPFVSKFGLFACDQCLKNGRNEFGIPENTSSPKVLDFGTNLLNLQGKKIWPETPQKGSPQKEVCPGAPRKEKETRVGTFHLGTPKVLDFKSCLETIPEEKASLEILLDYSYDKVTGEKLHLVRNLSDCSLYDLLDSEMGSWDGIYWISINGKGEQGVSLLKELDCIIVFESCKQQFINLLENLGHNFNQRNYLSSEEPIFERKNKLNVKLPGQKVAYFRDGRIIWPVRIETCKCILVNGERKGQECGKPISKKKGMCYYHACLAPRSESENTCKTLITQGKRVGKCCGRKTKKGSDYCYYHLSKEPNSSIAQKVSNQRKSWVCPRKIIQGPRKGQKCGKPIIRFGLCSRHYYKKYYWK